jgi:phosphonatase-like hydrolase
MSTIQLVVFDIAGTTVRDKGDVAGSFMEAFRHFGLEVPEEAVKKVMGFRKIEAIRILLEKFYPGHKDPKFTTDELIGEIHQRFVDRMVSFYQHDKELEPLTHAEEVFTLLKQQGIKVALDTGFTRSITNAILHRLNWDNGNALIDRVICSDEVPQGRPSPDMINTLIADLGIASSAAVLKVGDTEVDVAEGRNAGCGKVVSVTTGAYTRDQLETYHPDYIIDDLKELLPIIEKA